MNNFPVITEGQSVLKHSRTGADFPASQMWTAVSGLLIGLTSPARLRGSAESSEE
jgi:hypothetical protein